MKRIALFSVALLLGCSEPPQQEKTFSIHYSVTDPKQVEKIKVAGQILYDYCPSVLERTVTSVNASYSEEPTADYRKKALNWSDEVYFQVAETKSGHTHHIYVGLGEENPGIVVKKQPTLDFCKINYRKEKVDPICQMNEAGLISCRQVYDLDEIQKEKAITAKELFGAWKKEPDKNRFTSKDLDHGRVSAVVKYAGNDLFNFGLYVEDMRCTANGDEVQYYGELKIYNRYYSFKHQCVGNKQAIIFPEDNGVTYNIVNDLKNGKEMCFTEAEATLCYSAKGFAKMLEQLKNNAESSI